jgi:hypothetical protein
MNQANVVPGRDGALPQLSVVIPFGDPRGDPRYVKSWTRNQTCSPDAFEVIVVTHGECRKLDDQIRLHLRDTDRLVNCEANNRFECYDPGAEAATAPLLLLTEDHCVADPHCVEEVLRSQRADGWQAAMLHSGHISRKRIGFIEERLYEEMFERYWSKADYWDKVRIRGFAVLREHYFAAGGLPGQYSLFAESWFSARLHKQGVRSAYLPRAIVRHVSLTTFRLMRHEVWGFRLGECAFHDTDKTQDLASYLEPSADFAQRYARQRRVARRAAYAIGCVAWTALQARRLRMLGLLGRELLTRIADGISGSAWRAACSAVSSQIALVKYYFWCFSSARRLAAVRKYWEEISRCAQLWYCATHARELTPWTVSLGRTLPMTEIPAASVDSFYVCEQWQGRSFRWTSPVAIMSLRLDPSDYQVCLDTAALRGASCDFPFGLFLNGRRIAPRDLQVADGRITARMRASLLRDDGVQQLMIVSAPPPRAANTPVDPRPLGMPVHTLQFTTVKRGDDLPADAGRRNLAGSAGATGSDAHVA